MRIERFKPWFAEQLTTLPGVETVESYRVPDEAEMTDLKVAGSDGVSLYLRIVRATPQGDDLSKAEKIVTKDSPES